MDNRQIAIEAAEWLFRLGEDARPEDDAEFAAWLKRSPRHMGEFLFATAAFRFINTADPHRILQMDTSGMEAENVVALEGPVVRPVQRTSRWKSWALAAALAGAALVAWQQLPLMNGAELYHTRLGEQRSFKLDDGSILYLNTQSRARVDYSGAARDVHLIEGEALFIVARDSARPFRVHAGEATIQAVGTQFNVYRRADATLVSVVDGRVRISASDAAPSKAAAPLLGAGEEARITPDLRIARQEARDLTPALAWRQRRLVFEGSPLGEVAREFNRYNRAQMVIEGTDAQHLQITGVFNADEPHALVTFLRDNAALAIREEADRILISGLSRS